MASDSDYLSFLEKANQDPSSGTAKGTSSSKNNNSQRLELKSVDKGSEIPKGIKEKTDAEEWIYISDADEPFVPVSLKFDGEKLPDESKFATLISHPSPNDAEISILDIVEWDKQGQYKEVVDAVRTAAEGKDVRVYRVALGGTRVEYWVVAVAADGGRLVGVKALGVES